MTKNQKFGLVEVRTTVMVYALELPAVRRRGGGVQYVVFGMTRDNYTKNHSDENYISR